MRCTKTCKRRPRDPSPLQLMVCGCPKAVRQQSTGTPNPSCISACLRNNRQDQSGRKDTPAFYCTSQTRDCFPQGKQVQPKQRLTLTVPNLSRAHKPTTSRNLRRRSFSVAPQLVCCQTEERRRQKEDMTLFRLVVIRISPQEKALIASFTGVFLWSYPVRTLRYPVTFQMQQTCTPTALRTYTSMYLMAQVHVNQTPYRKTAQTTKRIMFQPAQREMPP